MVRCVRSTGIGPAKHKDCRGDSRIVEKQIPRGVYPERNTVILRFTQDDSRRARNDRVGQFMNCPYGVLVNPLEKPQTSNSTKSRYPAVAAIYDRRILKRKAGERSSPLQIYAAPRRRFGAGADPDLWGLRFPEGIRLERRRLTRCARSQTLQCKRLRHPPIE